MREPGKKLNVDEDGIDRDPEELHWILLKSGETLLDLARVPSIRMMIGPELAEGLAAMGAVCLEACLGYPAMLDKVLGESKMPEALRPIFKETLLKYREKKMAEDDDDEQRPDNDQIRKLFGDFDPFGTDF